MKEFIRHTIIFDSPNRGESSSAWIEHTPFAFFLISILRPAIFVELGVHTGQSYNAFCQAVKTLKTNTRCYGIDTWQGDKHAGFYDEKVYQELFQYQSKEYPDFSHLLKMTFDEGLAYFSDNSIDLLHIDGLHTYEAVKHDFESWLPKMSDKGIIILHDTEERERNFGVWKLWEEISKIYPSFNFKHGYGLGIVAVGSNVNEEFLHFIREANNNSFYQYLFSSLGKVLTLEAAVKEKGAHIGNLEAAMEKKDPHIANLEATLNNIYNSHGWKALLVYYRVRDKILPPDSIRREVIKSILHFNKASLNWKLLVPYYRIRDKIFPPNTTRRKVMKSIRDVFKKALSKRHAKRPQGDEETFDKFPEEVKDNVIQISAHTGDGIRTIIEDLDANLRKNLRIAFVSQPEYFRFIYEALDRDYDTREFILRWGGDINYYKGLIEFNPNIAFFFRPEMYPDELLKMLKGIKVALSSEPIPKYINGRLLTSDDMELRFNSLKGVKNKKYDYFFHYDKTSLRFLKENGLKVDGEFFFPVDTRVYRPYDHKKIWDWGFIGRSTSYREKFLGIPKRDFNGLHVAHGVYGEEFVRLMNACKIGINLHVDENVSLEPRVQMMMACKILTFSEPLTHNDLIKSGIHYVEFTQPEELWEKLQYYLTHDDEREQIALSGFELVCERLSSRLVFQKLIDRIVIENRERLKESGLSGISRSGKDYLRLDLGCGRFKRKCFIGVKKNRSAKDVMVNISEEFQGKDVKILTSKDPLTKQNIINKPSIAFVIPGQGISGGIMVVCQHANRLVKKGYNVVLINNNLNDTFKLNWFPNLLAEIIPTNKIKKNIDIIFATHWSTAYTVKKLPAFRKIYFVQSDETRFTPSRSKEVELARKTYTFDFEFVVIAKWLKNWLQDNFGKSAHYVPNGVDKTMFYPNKPLEPKGDKLRVLLEGPIDVPFKGMKEAFEVVDGMDCEVWCVSTFGRPKANWKCDRFFEYVPLEKMRQIYSSCDVLIKMSKVEGFFMPPLEMMACGGTVITGKVTGYDEYIVDGYNGLVVEQGDVKSAREKLIQLIEDRDLLNRLKKGGLETAEEWTWEYSNDQLEKIIKGELQAN